MAKYYYGDDSANLRFPSAVMDLHNFKDVDDAHAEVLEDIKKLMSEYKYAEAATYIETLKKGGMDLTPYMLSSANLNYIDQEIRNIEIYAKSKQQQIFYQTTEPEDESSIQDVWIY